VSVSTNNRLRGTSDILPSSNLVGITRAVRMAVETIGVSMNPLFRSDQTGDDELSTSIPNGLRSEEVQRKGAVFVQRCCSLFRECANDYVSRMDAQ